MEITKAQKYLFPALYFGYDYEFKLFLRNLAGGKDKPKVRINSYLGDVDYKKTPEKCIFLLLKVNENFNEILNTFKNHESYKDDYAVGGHDGKHHMIVCMLNNEQAYNYFMLSRYSKMYSNDVLEKNFYLGKDPKTKERKYVTAYHVFKKTEEKKEEIRVEFNISKKEMEKLELNEYDGILNMTKEIFNYNKLIK